MATDTVVEYLVKRTKGKKTLLKTVGVVCAAAALIIGGFLFSYLNGGMYIGFVFLGSIIAICAAVFLIRRFSVEYEYCFFSGELTIDRIYSQTSRSPLAEFMLKQVEEMGRFDPATFRGNDTQIICTADEDGVGGIYLKVPNNVVTFAKSRNLSGSYVVFVLENCDRVQENIKPYIRASVYREGMKSFS
ncbi:MAG: hypothetical protein E7554_11155 [Ruminococcaceae bacterium]|nr:hypothetical protein [Oscillospiraceae bacterium]